MADTPDRSELRRLVAVATPVPWEWMSTGSEGGTIWTQHEGLSFRGRIARLTGHQPATDAALIVAAVNALPALLDEIDRRGDALNEALIARDDLRDALRDLLAASANIATLGATELAAAEERARAALGSASGTGDEPRKGGSDGQTA